MNNDVYVLIEHLRGEVAEISYVLLAAARALVGEAGGRVIALLLGDNARKLGADLGADEIVYIDSPALRDFLPDPYQLVLAEVIKSKSPRLVLFGHTSMGTDVAGSLAAQLGLPLISSGIRLTSDSKFVIQLCGGKILAEGTLPGPTVLLTLSPGYHKPEDGKASSPPSITDLAPPSMGAPRVKLLKYVEPEAGDVDITKVPILVAVGRGIQNQDNIVLAEELADALGGAVCGSRPVVDQGWLAASRLVGKSGKHVRPRIYLALGISGAPEHMEAVSGSDVLVAVNTDPAAPIFDVAKYGAEVDMFDLLPPLTEGVRRAKG